MGHAVALNTISAMHLHPRPQLSRSVRRIVEVTGVLAKYGLAEWLSGTECDRAKAFFVAHDVLVTLFAADPRPVTVQALARDTLVTSGSLGPALERLESLAIVATEAGGTGEPPIRLTSSGRDLSAILIYSVLRAAVAPTAAS